MPVGRFQVMALLQAARAYTLGLQLESAHSWGLNRAIFYAAAKRGFIGIGAQRKVVAGKESTAGEETKQPEEEGQYHLGNDLAFTDKKESRTDRPIFTIGGKPQTEGDFERQIEARFGESFDVAWKEGLDYVQSFGRETLLSGSEFFSQVYRPVRDEYSKKWTELGGTQFDKEEKHSKVSGAKGKIKKR